LATLNFFAPATNQACAVMSRASQYCFIVFNY